MESPLARSLKRLLRARESGVLLALLGLVGIITWLQPNFASANNLQRHAAASEDHAHAGPVRLFLRLLITPRWLLGGVLSVVALVFHKTFVAMSDTFYFSLLPSIDSAWLGSLLK